MNRYMLLALLPLAACSGTARSEGTPPSGTGGNRTFAVEGFTGVDAAGPDDVDVRVGSGFSVRAEGDPKILDKLEIVKEGDTLMVRRKEHSFSWGGERKGAKIFITMPRMTAASTTGSGDMAVDHMARSSRPARQDRATSPSDRSASRQSSCRSRDLAASAPPAAPGPGPSRSPDLATSPHPNCRSARPASTSWDRAESPRRSMARRMST